MTYITNGKKIIAADGERKIVLSVSDENIKVSGNVIVSESEVKEAYKKGLSLVKIAEISLLDDKVRRTHIKRSFSHTDGYATRSSDGLILAR